MILDASPVTAFLLAEAVAEVIEPVRELGPWVMTSVGLAEVVDVVVRNSGADAADVAAHVFQLGLAEVVEVDGDLGIAAGALRAKHYHRTRRSVRLAECVAAALARNRDQPLATSDPHLLDLCWFVAMSESVEEGSDNFGRRARGPRRASARGHVAPPDRRPQTAG